MRYDLLRARFLDLNSRGGQSWLTLHSQRLALAGLVSEREALEVFEQPPVDDFRPREVAAVRAFDDSDEAMLYALEIKGVYVQRVKFTPKKLAAAYENLSMLIRNRVVSYLHYPELIAELNVFKSDFTFSGATDYSMQTAQQSGIHALCLVTYDVDPQALSPPFENVFYHYYPDLIRD